MKKILKVMLVVFVSIIFQCLLYFFTKFIQGPANVLSTNLDNMIPLITEFIYFYILWYFMIFFVPCRFYQKDKKIFYRYLFSFIVSLSVSSIIFILYPTTIIRPVLENKTFSAKLVNMIYFLDTPLVNCLPSIHCLIAFLMIIEIWNINLDKREKLIYIFLLFMIILSTLFVKQHVIIDVIASLIIVISICFLNKKNTWYQKYENRIEKFLNK